MAYFGTATPETILEPLFSERRITKYVTNGIEIHPGITVGELNRMIMRQIYGPSNTEPQDTASQLAVHPEIAVCKTL